MNLQQQIGAIGQKLAAVANFLQARQWAMATPGILEASKLVADLAEHTRNPHVHTAREALAEAVAHVNDRVVHESAISDRTKASFEEVIGYSVSVAASALARTPGAASSPDGEHLWIRIAAGAMEMAVDARMAFLDRGDTRARTTAAQLLADAARLHARLDDRTTAYSLTQQAMELGG